MSEAADAVIYGYQVALEAVQANNRTVIDELVQEVQTVGSAVDDFFHDQIAEIKGRLGASAANSCSDNEAEQDEAISVCEAWVGDNVSNAGTEKWVQAVLEANGVEAGICLIHDAVLQLTKPAQVYVAGRRRDGRVPTGSVSL